jgi:hypothetical protein
MGEESVCSVSVGDGSCDAMQTRPEWLQHRTARDASVVCWLLLFCRSSPCK